MNGRILGQAVIELGGKKQADDTLDLSLVSTDSFTSVNLNRAILFYVFMLPTIVTRSVPKISFEAFQFSENPVESNPLILESITQGIINENLIIIDHPLVQHKLTLIEGRKRPLHLFVSCSGRFHAPGL